MRGALTKIPGVVDIQIQSGDEEFTVTYDPAKVKPEALAEALVAAGQKKAKLKA